MHTDDGPRRRARGRAFRSLAAAGALAATATLLGCRSMGPRTIVRDRFEYTEAVGQSWLEQILLNTVRCRYRDVPTLVDVSQIVSGYELRRDTGIFGDWRPNHNEDKLGGSANLSLTDRPTITYTPVTGTKFARMLLAPLPAESLVYLIQTGWPADRVLPLTVRSINAYRNVDPGFGDAPPADPEFAAITAAIRDLQAAGRLEFRIRRDADDHADLLMVIPRDRTGTGADATTARLAELLGLGQDREEVSIRSGLLRGGPGEITLSTFPMVQVLMLLARDVEIPEEHLRKGWVTPLARPAEPRPATMRIRSGKRPPEAPFVAIRYLDSWYWVDAADPDSKGLLSGLAMVLRVLDTHEPGSMPALTIPAY